jgi:hypothetical protein
MVEVIVIAEGQTEEQFIKRVIAPVLRARRVFVKPLLLKTSQDARGGAVSFGRFMFNARNLLLSQPRAVLSCFLDLYKLDTDFPDYLNAKGMADLDARVTCLNTALQAAVVGAVGVRHDRFIAHIQPHEFEGLLFSDPTALVRVEPKWQTSLPRLEAVRASVPTPEHINDGYETKPSRRLETLLSPGYKKTRHGPLGAHEIGLTTMERECAHFKAWMDKLRALSEGAA